MNAHSRQSIWLCLLLLVGLIAGCVVGAGAADTAPAAPEAAAATAPEALSLDPMQAGELAAKTALQVLTAEEAINQAKAAVGQAAAPGGLSMGLDAIYGRTGPITSVQFSGQNVTLGSPQVEQFSASLTQPLYTGGRVQHAVRAARSGVVASQQQLETTRRSLRLAAQQAAYGVLRAQELAAVARRQTEANREHLRLSQAMFNAGTIAQFEVIQAQTQLAQSEGVEIAGVNQVEQAVASLRQILVLDQTKPLRVVAPTVPLTRPPGDLSTLIESGWKDRPELATLQAQVEAAESRLRLARAGLNPSVALNGLYNRSTASALSSGTTWQVTLGASVPIFDGGLTRSDTKSAESQLKQAQLALETEKQQVALDVTQPFLSLDQATKQLQVATQGVLDASERARVAEVRFQAGVTNGIEVIDAQTSLARAEATQVSANYDVQTSMLQLYEAMGQPLTGGDKQ